MAIFNVSLPEANGYIMTHYDKPSDLVVPYFQTKPNVSNGLLLMSHRGSAHGWIGFL